MGYLAASLLDIKQPDLLGDTQVLAQQQQEDPKPKSQKTVAKNSQATLKPKFEFFTLLTNEKTGATHSPSNHAVSSTTTTAQPASTRANPVVAQAKALEVQPVTTQPLQTRYIYCFTSSGIIWYKLLL